jgi:hypothetical protein
MLLVLARDESADRLRAMSDPGDHGSLLLAALAPAVLCTS